MKKSIKAALLSAFVFPGAGHLFFRHYRSGIAISGLAAVALYLLISHAITQTLVIANKITAGELALDIPTITAQVQQATTANEAALLSTATIVLIITWVVAVADSFRIGRARKT